LQFFSFKAYIDQAGNTKKWRVTEEGKIVSGAKPPRFIRQSVQDALAGIRERLESANKDPQAR